MTRPGCFALRCVTQEKLVQVGSTGLYLGYSAIWLGALNTQVVGEPHSGHGGSARRYASIFRYSSMELIDMVTAYRPTP